MGGSSNKRGKKAVIIEVINKEIMMFEAWESMIEEETEGNDNRVGMRGSSNIVDNNDRGGMRGNHDKGGSRGITPYDLTPVGGDKSGKGSKPCSTGRGIKRPLFHVSHGYIISD
ncbi:hypothetical protein L1887_25715 [Cichorium endivia]|nr:hypothetical protein L1887_25715 [Cichorium endivia]